MNRLRRISAALLFTAVASAGIVTISGDSSYAATCKPQFTGGASGNNCPKDKDVPGYEGHTYHTIRVSVRIEDPSGIDGGSGGSDTIYCDCGRSTQKCTVSASRPSVPGRTGSFVGGTSKSAGGANGKSSTVTFTYKLDPIPPFQLTTTTTVDKQSVQVGEVATFNHTVNRVSGRFPAANDITWKTTSAREGDLYPYKYANIFEAGLATVQRKQQDNRYLSATSGRGYGGGVTKVTIQKDTPTGVKICYGTSVNPSNNTGGTYDGAKVCTTVARADFNLVPTATLNRAGPVEPGESLDVTYRIQNTLGTAGGESASANWKSYGIKVNPGVDTTPITSGSPKEGSSPEAMIAALGGSSKASLFNVDRVNGTRAFPSNASTTVGQESFQLPNDAGAGAKYCFVLSIAPPTQNAAPTNRHSTASCSVVGKKPKVNIWGGDLFVGRRFMGDPVSPTTLSSSIYTSVSVYGGATSRAYGSWTEYDAHAAGQITGFATASGLQGGQATTSPDQTAWSKLTFANDGEGFGEYGSSSSRGTIPDIAKSMMTGVPVVKTFAPTENTFALPGANFEGRSIARYNKPTGDLTIDAGIIQKNNSVIITVPEGKVTIAGNLNYSPGPYANAKEIPQLIIIAKNITINSNVTSIDGWLVAKASENVPSGTNGSDPSNPIGVIKTCEVEGALTINVCNQRLTVNGPVMANQLVLRRTAGLAGPPSGVGATSEDAPAEIFNLRADTYLWIYSQGKQTTRAITTYSRELGPRF